MTDARNACGIELVSAQSCHQDRLLSSLIHDEESESFATHRWCLPPQRGELSTSFADTGRSNEDSRGVLESFRSNGDRDASLAQARDGTSGFEEEREAVVWNRAWSCPCDGLIASQWNTSLLRPLQYRMVPSLPRKMRLRCLARLVCVTA